MSDHPAQLFTDAELEPVEVVRRKDLDFGYSWSPRCRACRVWLTGCSRTADDARRSGLAALEGHRCAMPGELPRDF